MGTQGWSQTILERIAFNNLAKGKWEKSKNQLAKAIRKDSINAGAYYILSIYYFTPRNPAFHIDSAYRYANRALHDYELSSARLRDKLKRIPVDSQLIIQLRRSIDSAGFERAKKINTEKAYQSFMDTFVTAEQLERAKELREEVAYLDALRENTYESFLAYLNKYPEAARAEEARDRYEKLLFEVKTKDRKLTSYEKFLEEYPQSPYRKQAELQVFELGTASGRVSDFFSFIKKYPAAAQVRKARHILYYLLYEDDRPIPDELLTDSIKSLRKLEEEFLVPYLADGKFGFINASNMDVIPSQASDLYPDYVCGNITDDLLVMDNKLMARNKAVVYRGNIQEWEDLGYGYIIISSSTCAVLMHKSGFIVDECVQDATVAGGSFLAVKKENRWTLLTLTGRPIPAGEFEAVDAMDDLILVKQNGKWKVIKQTDLARVADQFPAVFSRTYDEVKEWNDKLLWVRAGDQQGLIDIQLREKIPFGRKFIERTFFGASVKSTEGIRLWSALAGETPLFQGAMIQKPWVAVKKNLKWFVLDNRLQEVTPVGYDSLYYAGPFFIGSRADSLIVNFSAQRSLRVVAKAMLQFLPGKDSTFFLLHDEGEKKTVFNALGDKLFTVTFDRIEYAGENLFIVTRKDKRGLINSEGKVIIPPELDGTGTLTEGAIPVLKDKKFGYIDLVNRREIKAIYERNLVPFSRHYLIAHKDGKYGIIDWNNRPVLPFDYEEVRYWNDSTALVKRNFHWIIYNFIEKKTIADRIRDFRWLRNDPEEKIIIIHQENNYGVVSNREGTILQATFSDIVNLGSAQKPLYFTEKHVEEASIYVVIYYDEKGNLLRRNVYEVEEYEKIYCRQK